jgi:HK97 gp10 family phage protein
VPGKILGDIRLEGGPELERKLAELDKKVAFKITSRALRAGAKVILKETKARAPKRSGLLRRRLKVRAGKRRKGSIRFSVSTSDKDYSGDTFYAAFVALGHKVGSRKLPNRKKVAPNRFMEESFDARKRDATEEMIRELRTGIRNATR